jgi:tetratricopeptide (TPR) repeat protein
MPDGTEPDPIDVAVELLDNARNHLAQDCCHDALTAAMRACSMLENECGADHPDVANAWLLIGTIHETLDNYDRAEHAYRHASTIIDQYADQYADLFADNSDIARIAVQTHTAVGTIERIGGNLSAATETLQAAIDLATTMLGDDDLDTAWVHNAYGIVCKYAGRFDEGINHYQRALRTIERISGPDSHDVAVILHNLGGILFTAGDYVAALEPARLAVAIHETLLGPDHPTYAADIAALAAILDNLGDHDEARRMNDAAIVIFERHRRRYDLAVLHNNLGVSAAARGDLTAAARHYSEALDLKQQLLGPHHPDIAITMHNLAQLAAGQCPDETAEQAMS